MNHKISPFILCLALLFPTCSKTPPNNGIPYVLVDYNIYLSNPDNQVLNAIGNWKYFDNVGSRGVIVYHKDLSEYVVYERHCTYKPEGTCGRVKVDKDNVTLLDSCCGSKFLLYDGSIINGPAVYPLKAYQVFYNNDILHVTN
jgi:nitrite reductase/ring-hydroxylating ferredoxin subunit